MYWILFFCIYQVEKKEHKNSMWCTRRPFYPDHITQGLSQFYWSFASTKLSLFYFFVIFFFIIIIITQPSSICVRIQSLSRAYFTRLLLSFCKYGHQNYYHMCAVHEETERESTIKIE